MVRYMIKFETNAIGHFNDLRRWVSVPKQSVAMTKIIEVPSPDDLREQIIKTGNELHASRECQLAVTTMRLTDIPPEIVKKYADAISRTEWNWIGAWFQEAPTN